MEESERKEKILRQALTIGRRAENHFARNINGNLGTDLSGSGIHSSQQNR
jgi:hypothetical protein